MLRHTRNTALLLLGFLYVATGLTLILTLTTGGIILGLFMIGLAVVICLLWTMSRVLAQIRELLMLSVSKDYRTTKTVGTPQADEEILPPFDMRA